MRGIVVAPEITIIGENNFEVNNLAITSKQIRQYLLYWDKVDFPLNFLSNATTPEIEYLKNVGFLKRSAISFSESGRFLDIFLRNQYEVYKKNNEADPGRWSLAQPNRKLVLNRDNGVLSRNLEIELYNSLPIPTPEVSIEDILIFKERRKDELSEFRALTDGLYLEILDSGDPERAKVKSIEQIQRKIIDINTVMSESGIKSLLGNLKIEVDVSQMVSKTVGGIATATIFNFPVGVGAALGFASSFIQVKSELSLTPKDIPEGLKDYAYLYYAQKNLVNYQG
ncbi:DUF6236 family protein [Peribacillus sp. NPDC096447]|uniref:DUF6236 family protein n=1 Tax=Peribacillus sp. NPDC096447 TaxID=3364394 RepID=UPI00381DE550